MTMTRNPHLNQQKKDFSKKDECFVMTQPESDLNPIETLQIDQVTDDLSQEMT